MQDKKSQFEVVQSSKRRFFNQFYNILPNKKHIRYNIAIVF